MIDRTLYRRAKSLGRALLLAALAFLCVPAVTQERFPAQSIELIVAWGRGGHTDVMARKLAPILSRVLGVNIDVVNVPGAIGNAGLTKMLMNPADGYTMTVVGSSTFASWESGIGFARTNDLRIIAFLEETPAMLFVRDDSPFKTFRDFLEYAKLNPETLRVSSWGTGTPEINLGVLGAQGYKVIIMPFAKAEQRFGAVLGRRADALFQEPVAVAELLQTGKLRPLVVFDAKRHPGFPNVPTVRESGLESADLQVFLTMAISAATPPDRAKILADAITKALASREWKEACAAVHNCAGQYTQEQIDAKLAAFRESVKRYAQPSPR